MDNQDNTINLSIGGLKFLFKLEDYPFEIKLAREYEPFLSDNSKPDVVYTIHSGKPPFDDFGSLLFDSTGYWKLYKKDDKKILSIKHYSGIHRICVMDKHFRSGEIYIDFECASTNDPHKIESLEHKSNPLQYPLDQLLMINILPQNKGVMLHSCGVIDNERGLLFVGESGAGKSTIAKLWDNTGAKVLNDDRIIIRKIGGELRMYGTPWCGEFKETSAKFSTIDGTLFIEHGSKNRITSIDPADSATKFIANSFLAFWGEKSISDSLDICGLLAKMVDCKRFLFVPDKTAVESIMDYVG